MVESISVCGAESLDAAAPRCPVCNTPGKKVKPKTVENIVKEDRIPEMLEGYALCLSKDCDVVYFGRQIFGKSDIKVKVWFKEKEHPIPVCYCKDVMERDIINHIAVSGCCKDIKDIQQHTGANTGKQCLIKNPAGSCCGPSVRSVIARALEMRRTSDNQGAFEVGKSDELTGKTTDCCQSFAVHAEEDLSQRKKVKA